jgi:hypothetical protein
MARSGCGLPQAGRDERLLNPAEPVTVQRDQRVSDSRWSLQPFSAALDLDSGRAGTGLLVIWVD